MTDNKNTDTKQRQANTPSSPKAHATDAPAPEKASKTSSGGRGGILLGAIAIALALGSSGWVFYHGHQQATVLQNTVAAQQSHISRLEQDLNQQQQAAEKAREQLKDTTQTRLNQQDSSLASLQKAVAEVKGRRPNDWLLAEADYLIRMAGRKIWLEHDAQSATALMEAADHRIAQLNDPSLMPIRQAMADDITALKAVKRVDRDGIVLRLTSMQQRVENLPLASAVIPEAEEVEKPVVSESVNDWKHNLTTSVTDFVDNFITYRKRDGNVVPLLSPTQSYYLQENLKNKLDQAMRAVYQGNDALYHEALGMAKDWALRFYNQDANATRRFVEQLDDLNQQAIGVDMPQKLKSQSLVSDEIDTRLRRDIAPLTGGQS
ncbi:uroporphyrinogen-III C-methyltransferase [Salinivibrio kushneri]|uniref:Uroporphyrinogen-III C-methyltransferase n=1 Tax=Salinivibrio kushneri TaxID=1908198 RepID=A0AA47KL28_9GAMM|nr:uroporphyrinogen-III C-methyltransferase [Salinivibrio kushneri]WBA08592.1 uroporphyrinogen-III C-methyltransferase [Salinivibrio kushneri]